MSPSKVQFGTQLPPDLVARVRHTVVELQRSDPSMTIAAFVEKALTVALDNLPEGVIPQESPADSTGITHAAEPAQLRPRRGRRVTTPSPAMTDPDPR